jgi:aspartate 1-decarboxylase
MLQGKIHRARVTEANLSYEGSITVDAALLEASGILPYEQVHVLDVTNGARLVTYAIEGPRDSGVVCVNGAAAHLVDVGDVVIILSYASMDQREARQHEPSLVYVDERNRITRLGHPIEAASVAAGVA